MSNNFQGEIITPDDLRYNQARQIWNRAIQKFPAAIVYCENTDDVCASIAFARSHHIPIRIRSGGHNYEGYCTGDEVLVIDVSNIKDLDLNTRHSTVTVGTGVNFRQLYNTVGAKGYPFPGGNCPTVAASGFTLGGGWGYSSRKFGLGCDSLLEAEMVDYKGRLLTANKEKNQDLFWALRGAGGGNFGVVTSLTFKLPPKSGEVTLFELFFPKATLKDQVHFMGIFQKWIDTVDDNINASGGMYNTRDDGIYNYLRGICYGSKRETEALLQPFLALGNVEATFKSGSFLDAMHDIGNSYPPFETFKSTGRFVNEYYCTDKLAELASIVNQKRPTNSILTSISVYGLGGKVQDVNKHDTAFYFRDARYIVLIQSVWEDNRYKEANVRWVLDNFQYIYGITEGSYINFPLLQLPNYACNYFGGNVPRLERVKHLYDPYNVFNFPQSI